MRNSFLILALAILTACLGSKSTQVVYTVNPAIALKNYTVYLVVNDRRALQDLVGPAARDQGLFKELRADRFDLRIKLPDGSEVTMTNLATQEAVKEAVSRRLTSRKVAVTAQRPAAQLTVEVDIRTFNIDVSGGDLVATVNLSARIYRDASAVTSSDTQVTSNRRKLLGGLGGDTVLSEALTQAVNDLDFSAINNY
ncbi:MAG: ABC-type transport auxiliary lipoprotein family protein [Deltaproteobacteria bacterium]|nr:ABC-type transport auxiliary lipoprotein family protein [Deltaproteobacteria bacterium]